MTDKDQAYWQKREEKLRAENRAIKDRLISLRKDYRQIEKELRNQRRLFNTMPGGVVLVRQEKIVAINDTALRETGYSLDECLGRNFFDFVHPRPKETLDQMHRDRAGGNGTPPQIELDLVTRNGETLECDVRIRKIRHMGRKAFLVFMARLENRKQREKEYIQAQKMEAQITMASGLNRQIGQSLETISRNIHRVRKAGAWEDWDILDGLKAIEEAAGRIGKTTRELAVLSGIENDRSNVTTFNLKELIDFVSSMIEPKLQDEAERRNVHYRLKIYSRALSPLKGNPVELRDAVANTILNAVDAMPAGGDIYVSTEENGGYAHIYIQDSGEGIAEPINGRILDPFFTTKGDGCIGLGLSLSNAIIKRHGGDIEVRSKKGQGTIVTIRLPIAQVPSPQEVRGSRRGKLKNAHILVIEAHHVLRELLAQTLTSKGFKTEETSGPLEGLNRLRKGRFDLVIADASMPDMKAGSLVNRVKKTDQSLPVVLIAPARKTGRPHFPEIPKADLIVHKPLDVDHFVHRISEVLIGR